MADDYKKDEGKGVVDAGAASQPRLPFKGGLENGMSWPPAGQTDRPDGHRELVRRLPGERD